MEGFQTNLLDIVTQLKSDLVVSFKNKGRSATGETEKKLEPVATENNAQLLAPWWIYALQDGRKPTRLNAPKGDPTLFDQIKLWCAAKGIEPNLAYPIAKSIHENGYPGTPGIIDEPLSDANVDKAMFKTLGIMASLYQNQVIRGLKIPDEKTQQLQTI